MEDPHAVTVYGFPEEARAFEQRHPLWHERMPHLERAIGLAFVRTQVMNTAEDKTVYLYGRIVVEEFFEIFLMVVNGYGIAAMKLLRSMYEHTVTLKYLHDHPEEVEAFIRFDRIQQYKVIKPVLETFGKEALPASMVEQLEKDFEEVKSEFMVPACKTCGTERLNHTWNRLDFVSMAKKAGDIGKLIVHGYYLPLRHAHSTFRTITDRLQITDGQMNLKRDSQPAEADAAFMIAHNCLLVALDIQRERFQIDGLAEAMQVCYQDIADMWNLPVESVKCPRMTFE